MKLLKIRTVKLNRLVLKEGNIFDGIFEDEVEKGKLYGCWQNLEKEPSLVLLTLF